MDVVVERVAGLDVHQATVVAPVRVPGPAGRPRVTETFGTMVPDLLALREWLQAYGPPPPIQELRDLTRYRVQQVRDRAREVNRLCKVLEDTGLKRTSVVTDVMGASGRAMLAALGEGTTDPTVLAVAERRKDTKKDS